MINKYKAYNEGNTLTIRTADGSTVGNYQLPAACMQWLIDQTLGDIMDDTVLLDDPSDDSWDRLNEIDGLREALTMAGNLQWGPGWELTC